MMKKEDGTQTFKAAPEDFPQKHKATILNIGIAETGTEHTSLEFMFEFVVFFLLITYFKPVMHKAIVLQYKQWVNINYNVN